MAYLYDVNTYTMKYEQVLAQWAKTDVDRRQGIIRAALTPGEGVVTNKINRMVTWSFERVVRSLDSEQLQTFVTRLAMDAGFVD